MILDREALWEQCGGDTEFVHELVGLYLSDTVARVDVIAEAVAAGDDATARREAHTVKGASGSICAVGVGRAAAVVENACGAQRAVALADLRAEMDALVPLLRDLLGAAGVC